MTRPPDVLRPADSFHVYDTTLRDGSQREGMALSVNDKLAIARHLDELGVGFVEGGWPGANPKDAEFFRRARTELDLSVAQLAAFGSTRRPGGDAAADLAHLRESGAGVVTLVAKADVRHVERALRTTREENLAMVRDSVAHLRAEGQRVFLDAEHFFDGYAADPAYAVEVLRAHRARQAEENLKAGPHYRDLGLIFATHAGTPLDASNVVNRSLKPLLEHAGLPPIRFHDLRHTCATLLLSAAVPPKVVQERLGHANIAMTMDVYSHVMPDLQESAAATLEAALE